MRKERFWGDFKRKPRCTLRRLLVILLLMSGIWTIVYLIRPMDQVAGSRSYNRKENVSLLNTTTAEPVADINTVVGLVSTVLPQHLDEGTDECKTMLGSKLIEAWRSGERLACIDHSSGVRVREFVQYGFEYRPQLYVYENVDFESPVGEILANGCPTGTYLTGEDDNISQPWAAGERGRAEYLSRNVSFVEDRVLVRISRFDVFNPYEAFHALINTYFLIQVLNLNQSNIQFAMTDDCADSESNEMLWNSVNNHTHPIFFKRHHGAVVEGLYNGVAHRFRLAIQSSSAGTSILCSGNSPLAGRDADHHCKSSAFRNATSWIRNNFGSKIQWTLKRPFARRRVIVAIRKAYKRPDMGGENIKKLWENVFGGATHNLFGPQEIKRVMARQDEFVSSLQTVLSSGFEVEGVNFAELDPAASIEKATNADIIVGVHGAALLWSAFLPQHGGIVEIFPESEGAEVNNAFGFGRLRNVNRHYHNLASLADLHFQELAMNIETWGVDDVTKVANSVMQINPNDAQYEPS